MSTGKTYAFIIHGSRAEMPEVRHLVSWVRDKGHHVEPRVTWEKGDASRFADEAASRGVDAVVALGGDGTVNEVVNGLSGHDVPLGIIPLGTANDFARQAGIPLDADHAMDIILRRNPVRIDTGEVNGRRYLNASVGGVGAEATAETPAESKEALGLLAYAITGVRKLAGLTPRAMRFRGPGVELDTECLVFAVGNSRATGGGTEVTPRACLSDGLLDVCIVEAMGRTEFVSLGLRVRKGEHLGEDGVHYFQLPRLTIDSDEPITVNVDGEPAEEKHLEYRVRPGDLLVHVGHLPGEE